MSVVTDLAGNTATDAVAQDSDNISVAEEL